MIKICVSCNKEFTSSSGKQVCCSKKCNVAKWRKLNPDKNKENSIRSENKRKGTCRYNSQQRKEWYKNKSKNELWSNKIKHQANIRRSELMKFIREYKISKGCSDCGYKDHHVALDFDHIDGIKELNICNAKSINQAKKEIEKCEVVCSNCHRIRTYKRLHLQDMAVTYEPV